MRTVRCWCYNKPRIKLAISWSNEPIQLVLASLFPLIDYYYYYPSHNAFKKWIYETCDHFSFLITKPHTQFQRNSEWFKGFVVAYLKTLLVSNLYRGISNQKVKQGSVYCTKSNERLNKEDQERFVCLEETRFSEVNVQAANHWHKVPYFKESQTQTFLKVTIFLLVEPVSWTN